MSVNLTSAFVITDSLLVQLCNDAIFLKFASTNSPHLIHCKLSLISASLTYRCPQTEVTWLWRVEFYRSSMNRSIPNVSVTLSAETIVPHPITEMLTSILNVRSTANPTLPKSIVTALAACPLVLYEPVLQGGRDKGRRRTAGVDRVGQKVSEKGIFYSLVVLVLKLHKNKMHETYQWS